MFKSLSGLKKLQPLITPASIVFFVICMIISPKNTFEAALTGLKAWWNIVFPALLPFFIGSELLINFGIVRFMGVLLEPIMRPIFNLPGPASFVMAMGFTSGYPISAILTVKLREDKLCTRYEGERLISFTNNASPLFMLGAVAVGMLGNEKLGIVIAGGHYLASICLGIMLRFYKRNDHEKIDILTTRGSLFRRALRELVKARKKINKPLGRIFSDAVSTSVQRLITIGGFIILFAVFIRLLDILGALYIINSFFGLFLEPLGFQPSVINALGSGLFEITLGCKFAAESSAPLIQKLIIIGIILAWSGLSVHAQVASIVSTTDIKVGLFMICRFIHGILSAIFTAILYKTLAPYLFVHQPVWFSMDSLVLKSNWFYDLKHYTLTFIYATVILLAIGIIFNLLRNTSLFFFYATKKR